MPFKIYHLEGTRRVLGVLKDLHLLKSPGSKCPVVNLIPLNAKREIDNICFSKMEESKSWWNPEV